MVVIGAYVTPLMSCLIFPALLLLVGGFQSSGRYIATTIPTRCHSGPSRYDVSSAHSNSALFASSPLLPWEEGFVDVPRGSNDNTLLYSLYYRIYNSPKKSSSNNKPPLVICHGGPSLPSQYLYPLVNLLLDDDRPILFYDQLGCGKSDEPKDLSCYSIPQFVDDLKRVIWHAIAPIHSSFHLYGHSFGGILAFEYLIDCLSDDTHSQSTLGSTLPACRSVILSNTPTDLGQCNRDYDRLYAKNPLLFWKRHACRVGTPVPLQDAMNHAGSVWMGMDAVIDYQATPLTVTQRTNDSNLVPFLVISCERDFAFETSNESSWKAVLPSSNDQGRFVTLNDCAHYPFYEDKTAYSTILQEFLLPLDGHV